jgi:hypothetical protein
MIAMRFLPKLGRCRSTDVGSGVAGETKDADVPSELEDEESNLLKTVGWVSAALGAVAIGLLVGRELRLRYKFNRRTPYDLYAHSGDELPDVDCGVGI